jgi:hypothetical protein
MSEGRLLAGLCYCRTCERRLSPNVARSEVCEDVRIYRSKPGAFASGPCPNRARIMAREIEPIIVGNFRRALEFLQTKLVSVEPLEQVSTAALEAAVRRAQANLDAWDDAFDADFDPAAIGAGHEKRKRARSTSTRRRERDRL